MVIIHFQEFQVHGGSFTWLTSCETLQAKRHVELALFRTSLGIVMAQDSIQQSLFRVGDEVRFAVSKTTGFVRAVECDGDLVETSVFYRIKIPYGSTVIAKPDEIEPLE